MVGGRKRGFVVEGGGEEDGDLEPVLKSVLKHPGHEVVLMVRLESPFYHTKRYLLVVSAPSVKHKARSTAADRSVTPQASCPPPTSPLNSAMSKDRAELDYCLLGVDSITMRKRPDLDLTEDTESRPAEDLVSGDPNSGASSQSTPTNPPANAIISVGFVLKLFWDTKISLDGDGGFSVRLCSKHYVFKPATVQALWTAIQTLHLIIGKLKPKRNSLNPCLVDWVTEYESCIDSPQFCINEWNAMPDVLVKRAPSHEEMSSQLTGEEIDQDTKKTLIKSKLRQIMKDVDLDDITSKKIRTKLEEDLGQSLHEFKAFIDEEILLILGQMDPASQIFDFLFLGSEWNASNLEELQSNGVTHILNVTKEIDNFFPSVFQYLNIREYDVEETDLLKYWSKTYNFIKRCVMEGGKVLVHCKMGISRSASTVVAFAMKYYDWTMDDALQIVKKARNIVQPNDGFMEQLQIYEGILEANRQRITFRKHRSKSESNVNLSRMSGKTSMTSRQSEMATLLATSNKPFARLPSDTKLDKIQSDSPDRLNLPSGRKQRPKSWSPSSPSILDKESAVDFSMAIEKPVSVGRWGLGPESESKPVVCHCYGELEEYFEQNNVIFPSRKGEYLAGNQPPLAAGVGSLGQGPASNDKDQLHPDQNTDNDEQSGLKPSIVESVELRSASNGDELPPSAHVASGRHLEMREKRRSCPARTHINQCTCNIELELKVSDRPVSVEETSVEDETILRNLGNFTIHCRQRAAYANINKSHASEDNEDDQWSRDQDRENNMTLAEAIKVFDSKQAVNRPVKVRTDPSKQSDGEENNNPQRPTHISLDTSGCEELSVKTLADMFDYKVGEVPAKPPLSTKQVSKLCDSKINPIAKKLPTMSDCSEC